MASKSNFSRSIVDRSVAQVLQDFRTASNRNGISVEVERLYRLHGASLVAGASRLLKLGASTHATACTIYHRYCHQVSLKDMDVWSVAMGATILGCKIEEDTRAIRHVILVYARLYRRRRLVCSNHASSILEASSTHKVAASRQASGLSLSEKEALLRQIKPMSPLGPVFHEWYKTIVDSENKILRQLGFTLYWIPDSHPHKFILYFVRVLMIENDENRQQELSQRAWNYCNDSCLLDLCLRHEAEVIACAALYMATRDVGLCLPANWWRAFCGPDHDKEISAIGNAILSLRNDEFITASNAFIPSMTGNAFNDPESYLWSVAD